MLKAVLLDFDGTLVTEDILTYLAEIVGKKEESDHIDQEFKQGKTVGLSGLLKRINLLKGVSVSLIEERLKNSNFLMPGAPELLEYFRQNNIVTILASGNILPVLQFYQKHLGIDYIIGANPKIENDIIVGIEESDFSDTDFKLFESKKILEKFNISADETLAIGDSPGDKSRFEFAKYSIAINPKGGVENFASHVIRDDLRTAIPFIENLAS